MNRTINYIIIVICLLFSLTSLGYAQNEVEVQTALRSYDAGDYETAQRQFAAILNDATTGAEAQRLALYWRGRSELAAGQPEAAILTLGQFAQTYPDDPLKRATYFNMGVAHEQLGQIDAALAAYQQSLAEKHPVDSYIYERMGDASRQTTNFTDTIHYYQQGVNQALDRTVISGLQQKIAAVELERKNPAGAIKQYESILKFAKIGWFRAKIYRLMGDAYRDMKETTLAHEQYQAAIAEDMTAYDSYLALVELVDDKVPVDEFQRGIINYHAESYLAAVAAFDRYLASGDTAHVADALWHKGLSQQEHGSYSQALETYTQFIAAHPEHVRWAQAHLEKGRMLAWLGRVDEALSTYRTFANENPTLEGAGEALWQAGLLEYNNERWAAAQLNLEEMASRYALNDNADEALYWAGRAAYQQKEYEAAAQLWGKLATTYADGELSSFGAYWQGRALTELGRTAEAEAAWQAIVDKPFDYYALRARDQLTGQSPHTVPLALPSEAQMAQEQAELEAWLAEWAKPNGSETPATISPRIQQDLNFQRGEALSEMGLRTLALNEFEQVKDNWWSSAMGMYQLALYFREQNMGRLSIITADRVRYLSPAATIEETPIALQRLFYPIYYPEWMFTEAEALGIDPALAIALTRQESLFEHTAESYVGARGLMQVMPATGDYIAQSLNYPAFTVDDLWRPMVSIKFGNWYISQQLGLFEGKHTQFAALAAYNAGPGNVLEWVEVSDDLDIFVEEIPYRESRLYIRRVYLNLEAYRRLYGVGP